MIENHLIAWLEMELAPRTLSQGRMDELDGLTEKWVNSHHGRRQTSQK